MPVGDTVTAGNWTPAAGAEVHTAYLYATVPLFTEFSNSEEQCLNVLTVDTSAILTVRREHGYSRWFRQLVRPQLLCWFGWTGLTVGDSLPPIWLPMEPSEPLTRLVSKWQLVTDPYQDGWICSVAPSCPLVRFWLPSPLVDAFCNMVSTL